MSNGFATLFLVFHPYYADSFQFTADADEQLGTASLMRKSPSNIIRGTRSPARWRCAIASTRFSFPAKPGLIRRAASIAKDVTTVGSSMEDVGLKTMESEVDYTPVVFHDLPQTYWFPVKATVEVATPRQHWRNTHLFSDYKLFSVSTDEKVANNK